MKRDFEQERKDKERMLKFREAEQAKHNKGNGNHGDEPPPDYDGEMADDMNGGADFGREEQPNDGKPTARAEPEAPSAPKSLAPSAGVQRFLRAARFIGEDDPLDGPLWVLPGFLQEHQTAMLPGPTGSGKSFVIIDLLSRVSKNLLFLGKPVLPGGTVYRQVKDRVVSQSASLQRPARLRCSRRMHFSTCPLCRVFLILRR
jgi:hypothetical protein